MVTLTGVTLMPFQVTKTLYYMFPHLANIKVSYVYYFFVFYI